MAATEACAAVVQEDGKTPENKPSESEPSANNANSETVNNEVMDKDGMAVNNEVVDKDRTAVNSEVVDNKETVNNDTAAEEGEGVAEAASGEATAPPQSSENAATTEPKTSFLDSFLNKSGLGKVMGGRKKKGGGEEGAADGGEKEGDKGEEAPAAEGAEGGPEGDTAIEKAPENGEKEEEKKGKTAEAKNTVRDLIRKPVARIFSHRSTDKKDGTSAEPHKQVKVRSKSLDRLEDAEALNTADSTVAEGGAEGGTEGGAESDQKTSSSAAAKHMKRWHSFKKLMAQKAHKRSSGGGEDGKEEEGEGGGDSSTLDSKESGQKRWKLKRSWTFQGLKRDPSMVGISGKTKSSEKESTDASKLEETEAGGAEGGEEAKEGGADEAKTEAGEEKEKTEGAEDEKTAVGSGTVTQHANEIWTSFKKRVIPKSKRANTECAPSGEEDTTTGEDGGAEDGKDAKSAKAKRSHFGRAVSLKNFILRKGKSTSVDLGEGAKEEEDAVDGEGGGDVAEEGAAENETTTTTNETNDKDAEEKTPASDEAGEGAEKTVGDTLPVTNGENGCSNGTAEENATHNHKEEEEKTTGSSPVKKSKEGCGAKEEANAKIINTTATVNSDKKAENV